MTDQQRIAEITARCEAATPGPWTVENTNLCRAVIGGTVELLNWAGDKPFYSKDDFAFIAHAREDIPFLLAEIYRLTEAQRWIPVSERLPDKDVLVLLFLESGNQTKITTSPDFLHKETITHWMPLPAAPCGKDGEGE